MRPKLLFSHAGEEFKKTNKRTNEWWYRRPCPSFKERKTLGRYSPIFNSIPPPKKDILIFTQHYSCDDPPEGKHPALGCLVFLQICRPSRKPKINMRKTARINLAACAEKLGVSMIAPTYFLEQKNEEEDSWEAAEMRGTNTGVEKVGNRWIGCQIKENRDWEGGGVVRTPVKCLWQQSTL